MPTSTVTLSVTLALHEPVTARTVRRVLADAERMAAGRDVVIDLTGMPSFDVDGLAELVTVADERHYDVRGVEEAADRLLGLRDVEEPPQPGDGGWSVSSLRGVAVLRCHGASCQDAATLRDLVDEALLQPVTTLVIDLIEVATLEPSVVQAIADCSSLAAVSLRQLLVVNVHPDVDSALREQGLSVRTFLAPAP